MIACYVSRFWDVACCACIGMYGALMSFECLQTLGIGGGHFGVHAVVPLVWLEDEELLDAFFGGEQCIGC